MMLKLRTRVYLTALVGLAMAALATPAAAADPVINAIRKAGGTGGLTYAEKRAFVKQWKSSGTAAQKLGRRGLVSRAREISNVRSIALSLAKSGRLSADRLAPVMANVRATTYVFQFRPYPRSTDRITVPFDDDVVFAYYPGNGMQLQPLFTFARANTLFGRHEDLKLIETAERMEELAVTRSGYTAWEFYFSFGGGKPPWVSCMAQGVGLQVYTRTYLRTQDPKYLGVAKRALGAFKRTPNQGGCAVADRGGKWFLLYSFAPWQRILNGHLQGLIGLQEYAAASSDQNALSLLSAGVISAEAQMPRFDTGAWSRYSPAREAPLEYHDLMTHQLKRLATKLGNETFRTYADRYATYRVTPPTVLPPSTALPLLYPYAQDDFRDEIPIRYFVDKTSRVTVRIRTQEGKLVRSMRFWVSRGRHAAVWNARTGSGRLAPEGLYKVEFAASDIVGNDSLTAMTPTIELARDATAPTGTTPILVKRNAKTTVVKLRVRDPESAWVDVRVLSSTGKVLAKTLDKGFVRLIVARPLKDVQRGALRLRDTTGNTTLIDLSPAPPATATASDANAGSAPAG